MAYSRSTPPQLIEQSISGIKTWSYSNADALSTVSAAGYFSNGYDLGMRDGDSLVVTNTSSRASTLCTVRGVSGSTTSLQLQSKLPIAGGDRRKMALLGDSISYETLYIDSSTTAYTPYGWGAWMRRFCGQRIDLPPERVYAVNGKKVADVLTEQVPQAIAAGVEIAVLHIGTNDLNFGVSTDFNAMVASYTGIIDAMTDAGIFLIVIPPRVRGSGLAFSGDELLKFSYVIKWLHKYVKTKPGATIIDVNPTYLNFATGNAISTYLRDNVHDNTISAIAMGRQLAAVINNMVPLADDHFAHLGDVYDATKNPTGNLFTNGLFAGTGGTTALGASGTVATSWTMNGAGGMTETVVCSKGTDATYSTLATQIVTLGGTTSTQLLSLFNNITFVPPIAVGDTVQMTCDLDYTITTGNISGVFIEIGAYDAGFGLLQRSRDSFDDVVVGGYFPTGTTESVSFETPKLLVPAGTAYVFNGLAVKTGASSALNAVFKWKRAALRKVI